MERVRSRALSEDASYRLVHCRGSTNSAADQSAETGGEDEARNDRHERTGEANLGRPGASPTTVTAPGPTSPRSIERGTGGTIRRGLQIEERARARRPSNRR